MKILISAAETSSDAHGAELLKAIREQLGKETVVEVFGIGGPKLQSQGLNAIVDARELLAMGFTEVLGHLPRVLKALNQITEAASELKPDLAIVIDYPDFHFRLARRLKKLDVPVVYYIPPKVWAWRKGRVEVLRTFFVRILCILPFEETFYRNLNIPVKYVGNPLVDELPLDLSREEARRSLSLSDSDKVLVLMPGSRSSELKVHFDLMLDAAEAAAESLRTSGFLTQGQRLQVLMPFPLTANLEALQQNEKLRPRNDLIEVRISQGNAAHCLVAADAGLIKSGTSTLEAGLLRCPHAVIYKATRTTAFIFKNLIRYRGPVGLVNLVADWRADGRYDQEYLVREIVLGQVTLRSLTDEIISLMTQQERREKMIQGFELLREKVCGKAGTRFSPSVSAAREVIQVLSEFAKTAGAVKVE